MELMDEFTQIAAKQQIFEGDILRLLGRQPQREDYPGNQNPTEIQPLWMPLADTGSVEKP